MTRPEYGKPETWPYRIPAAKDWTKVPGYEEPPTGLDERVSVTQRYGVGSNGIDGWEEFGAWDWWCRVCNAGNGQYPIGKESAIMHAHQHLRDNHPANEEDR